MKKYDEAREIVRLWCKNEGHITYLDALNLCLVSHKAVTERKFSFSVQYRLSLLIPSLALSEEEFFAFKSSASYTVLQDSIKAANILIADFKENRRLPSGSMLLAESYRKSKKMTDVVKSVLKNNTHSLSVEEDFGQLFENVDAILLNVLESLPNDFMRCHGKILKEIGSKVNILNDDDPVFMWNEMKKLKNELKH